MNQIALVTIFKIPDYFQYLLYNISGLLLTGIITFSNDGKGVRGVKESPLILGFQVGLLNQRTLILGVHGLLFVKMMIGKMESKKIENIWRSWEKNISLHAEQ